MKVLSVLTIILFSFIQISQTDKGLNLYSEFYAHYSGSSHKFLSEVNSLDSLIHTIDSTNHQQELKNQIDTVRASYKRIEYLFDYFNTKYNYYFINGGPLPKIDIEAYDDPLLQPLGLQRLDELIYSEDALDVLPELIMLSSRLLEDATGIIEIDQGGLNVTPLQFIESLRSGIIRVFTLGLTGFDTPGSGHGISEAIISMNTMRDGFSYLKADIPSYRDSTLTSSLDSLYHLGIDKLRDQDFESFDRMAFLKEVVNPIYSTLRQWQEFHELGDDYHKSHAQNYSSINLFDEDFLDLNYFSQYSFLPLDDLDASALGKSLFYDTRMSKTNAISCATCHQPDKAFTDGEIKSLTNTAGKRTLRNAPSLVDVAYSNRYFWDMREYDLEKQIGHVVKNELEFGLSFKQLSKKLAADESYFRSFQNIYAGHAKEPISRRTISHAIASYLNTLNSFNSDFDKYVRGELDDYSASAINGFNLFMGKANCGTCHFAPVFNGSVPPYYDDSESEVLGVLKIYDTLHPVLDSDPGRYENGLRRDAYAHFQQSFKTVTVRNAELTAPYMHNGSIKDLEELIDFYDRGGGEGMGVQVPTQTLSPDPLHLTEQEKKDLIEFLKTLTDLSGLLD